MKKTRTLAAVLTLAVALSGSSLFADPRHDDRTERADRGRRVVAVEGRIRDIDRDRNGFVISLDRTSYRIFAPVNAEVRQAARGRARVRQLERGDVIRVRGPVAGRNVVYASSIDLLRDRDGRDDRYDRDRYGRLTTVHGIVESVDHNRGVLWLRDDHTRRTFAVEMDRNQRYDGYGYDFRDVRRGDRVEVDGVWRGDRFFARDIDRQARAW